MPVFPAPLSSLFVPDLLPTGMSSAATPDGAYTKKSVEYILPAVKSLENWLSSSSACRTRWVLMAWRSGDALLKSGV